MHGYDLNLPPLAHHGPLSTGQQMGGPPGGGMDTGLHHHPDSTDSYVTYLESDDSMQGSP